MVADQCHLVEQRANLRRRSIHQRQAQIVCREVKAIQIPADVAIGSEHDHAQRMGVFVRVGIVGVVEADRVRQTVDIGSSAGQHVPVGGALALIVPAQLAHFDGRGLGRSIAGIDAHAEYRERERRGHVPGWRSPSFIATPSPPPANGR